MQFLPDFYIYMSMYELSGRERVRCFYFLNRTVRPENRTTAYHDTQCYVTGSEEGERLITHQGCFPRAALLFF